MGTINDQSEISRNGDSNDDHQYAEDSRGISELQLQAWELLEFTNIRQLLAKRTRFFMSRQMALDARPLVDIEDVERLQDETAQAALMLSTVGGIGLV